MLFRSSAVVFAFAVRAVICHFVLYHGSRFETFAGTGVFDHHALGRAAVLCVGVAVAVCDVSHESDCAVAVVGKCKAAYLAYITVFVVGSGNLDIVVAEVAAVHGGGAECNRLVYELGIKLHIDFEVGIVSESHFPLAVALYSFGGAGNVAAVCRNQPKRLFIKWSKR